MYDSPDYVAKATDYDIKNANKLLLSDGKMLFNDEGQTILVDILRYKIDKINKNMQASLIVIRKKTIYVT
jgi:hypothetical protein